MCHCFLVRKNIPHSAFRNPHFPVGLNVYIWFTVSVSMRTFLRLLFPAVLMVAVTGVPAFGQSKIATVDLKKLFENYYKTKLATAAVQQHADELDQEYTQMAVKLKKGSDDYQTMLESAND